MATAVLILLLPDKQLHLLACQVGKPDTDFNQAGLEQIANLHKGLKQANADVVVCHVLDGLLM